MAIMRIGFVGDSITVGIGDQDFIGWPGRACISEARRGHDVTMYNLGVRGDTSEMIRARWRAECDARLPPEVNGRLVFSFGVNDMADDGTGLRVPFDRSLENARAILSEANAWLPTLMLGPIPTVEDMQPYVFPSGIAYHFRNAQAAELSAAYADICAGLGIPYFDLHAALSGAPGWERAQREVDGVHAADGGYAMIASLLEDWEPWRAWFAA